MYLVVCHDVFSIIITYKLLLHNSTIWTSVSDIELVHSMKIYIEKFTTTQLLAMMPLLNRRMSLFCIFMRLQALSTCTQRWRPFHVVVRYLSFVHINDDDYALKIHSNHDDQ